MTAAFGAGKDTIDVAYDVPNLSHYLDYVHLMCYDYHGAWDQKTGANAPLHAHDVLSVVSIYYIDYRQFAKQYYDSKKYLLLP